jgi:allantoinase
VSESPRRLAISSRRVLTEDMLGPATVVVEDGTIIEIVHAIVDPAGMDERIDLGELVLSAGLVDPHVHVNEPGRAEWEGFWTATRAAAAGGVTTLVDMPLNCIPATTTADALAQKIEASRGQLWVDVGFWGGVVPGNVDELAPLAAAGVLGCKAFLCPSGVDEFPMVTEHDLRRAMERLRAAGIPLLAHAELESPVEPHDRDVHHYRSWLESRPKSWEDDAIALLIRLCRETGCAVHIVHLSSADSIPQLRTARAEGLPITVETCAHYLSLCAEEVPDGDTTYKCAPPIREDVNRRRLWEALRDGVIDFVVTDHSPCTPQLKAKDKGDFHGAWGGIASLQLGLPSVWTEARARGFYIPEVMRWLTQRPAAFAGLGSRKGRVAPGCDADLVAWDPEAEVRIDPERLQFRHKLSPYIGRTFRGDVRTTWLRGRIVYDAGGFADAPLGQPLLHRDRLPPTGRPS